LAAAANRDLGDVACPHAIDVTVLAGFSRISRIKQVTAAIINITTGGSAHMQLEESVLPAATLKPEVASLNMGSMNFGLFNMLDRYPEFKHDWERKPP
jgi:uncharacterized protein (DUF849 family)